MFFAAFFSFTLAAQVRAPSFSERILSPGPQVASGQDSWSLFNNPAGLAFVNGSELVGGYAYSWKNPSDRHQMQLASTFNLFEGFSVGLGMGFVLPQDQTPNDQGLINGQFGISYRVGRALSFGFWSEKQRRYALPSSDPFLFGFGVQYYPTQWLSLGILTKEVYGDFGSAPEFQGGLGIRPLGDELTLFAEARMWPNGEKWSSDYDLTPLAGFRLDLEGASLIGNVVFQSNPLFMFAMDFSMDHFGLGVVGGNDYVGGRFRTSSEAYSDLSPGSNKWVQVEINSQGTLNQEFKSLSAKLFSKPISPLFFLDSLDKLSRDKTVRGVVIHLEPLAFGFGRAEELRASLLALKNNGKQVVVYLNNASVVDYYVASVAHKIYLNPGAELKLDNFRKTLVYLKKGLDELGIEPEAIIAGKYKSAPRLFTASSPNEQDLEVNNAILDERYEHFIASLTQKTGKSVTQVKDQINLGGLNANEALNFGLVDVLSAKEDILELKESFKSYFLEHRPIKTWGELERIAIIPISGTIIAGHNNPSFFFPRSQTGAADVVDSIEQASKNPHVKGILLRVDSPGGDAFGSDQIYQALLKAREKKPIVTSMADVAASGGYYAAAATHQIWAEPSTLTGSIGVFSLHFSAQKLFNQLGISSFELKKGQLPGSTLFRPFSVPELKRQQELIDWKYDRFKKAVAEAQGLSLEHVSQVAEGHVWTGEQALANKLVHRLGGFSQALAELKVLAKIPANKRIQLSIYQVQGFNFALNPFASIEDLIELNGKTLALMPYF